MSDKVECAGFTKSGSRCKRNVTINSIYCWQHKEIVEEKKEMVEEKKEVIKNSKSYLSLISIPITAVITNDQDDYLTDSASNEIFGHGPFNILVPVGEYNPIYFNIEYTLKKDYTLKQIIDKIREFYNTKLTKIVIKDLINQDELGKDLYDELLVDLELGKKLHVYNTTGDSIFIELFIKTSENTYKLILGS
jgi:hypothetical protein